ARSRRPLRSSLFPYTTLFRSQNTLLKCRTSDDGVINGDNSIRFVLHNTIGRIVNMLYHIGTISILRNKCPQFGIFYIQLLKSRRSEEHTSELQSRENLVCRLL